MTLPWKWFIKILNPTFDWNWKSMTLSHFPPGNRCVNFIPFLRITTAHEFRNGILLMLLCKRLTYSKLPLASHHTSACSYWPQPAGGLCVVIEWGETAAGKVLADGCVLVVARTHPKNTHFKSHPQANSHLASIMATSMSWGASQIMKPDQRVQFPFKI